MNRKGVTKVNRKGKVIDRDKREIRNEKRRKIPAGVETLFYWHA